MLNFHTIPRGHSWSFLHSSVKLEHEGLGDGILGQETCPSLSSNHSRELRDSCGFVQSSGGCQYLARNHCSCVMMNFPSPDRVSRQQRWSWYLHNTKRALVVAGKCMLNWVLCFWTPAFRLFRWPEQSAHSLQESLDDLVRRWLPLKYWANVISGTCIALGTTTVADIAMISEILSEGVMNSPR